MVKTKARSLETRKVEVEYSPPAMASMARISSSLFSFPNTNNSPHHTFLLLPKPLLLLPRRFPPLSSSPPPPPPPRVHGIGRTQHRSRTICSAANRPSPSTDVSSTARIRSEVLSPFRSLRMFFYLAFIASAALGGLIATTQLIASLTNPARSAEVPEISKGLGIDLGAVFIFAFLYSRDHNAKEAQVARLTREESLSNLKLRVDEKKVISMSDLRGIARLVILAGPASFIAESFERSKPFSEGLIERGVLVVPFATDGTIPTFDLEESSEIHVDEKKKRLWQLSPVYASEWSKWLDEQKKLAKVSPDSPVYLSLRMDGRVRGSGVGYPPWNAFVAQLPPVKGFWTGLFDGFDGRV